MEIYEMLGAGLMRIIIAVIVLLCGKIIIPWLKEQRIYSLIVKLVRAAEKLGESGMIEKESKKTYVIKLLVSKGYSVTPEIEAFIEAAVTELDLALDSGMLIFPDILDETEIEYEYDDDLADEIIDPVTAVDCEEVV